MKNLCDYLKARWAEPTTKTVALAFIGALGTAMAAGASMDNALYAALGAGLVAAVGALTPEKASR